MMRNKKDDILTSSSAPISGVMVEASEADVRAKATIDSLVYASLPKIKAAMRSAKALLALVVKRKSSL